tara:strand:+ start:7251 stop:7913 length:663 start_codon:yes stop_codon:yes gene_type:complete
MPNKFGGKESRKLIQGNSLIDDAFIDLAQSDAPQIIRTLTIKLDDERTVGNAFKVGFAYKSLFVSEASDSATEIQLRPFTSSESNDTFPLKQNGVLNFDLPIKNAFFTWEAQAGKTITLIFLLNGSFRPGSLFTEVSSAVEGNSFTPNANVNISAAALLIAANLNRTVLEISSSAAIEISGTLAGNYVPMSGNYKLLKNTAAIYARAVSGTVTVQTVEQE